MRLRSSYGRLILPLIVGGVAVMVLLPGGDPPPATSAPAPVPKATQPEIAIASLGEAMLSPVPLTETAPAIPKAAPVVPATAPSATVRPVVTPPTEVTASIDEDPGPMEPSASGRSSFVGYRPVNMRVGPSKDTASVTVLQPGEPLQILEESEGWTYVATISGDTGWVSSRFLGNAKPAATPDEDRSTGAGNTIRVRGAVTIRSAPAGDADRLFVVRPGEKIRIAETRGNWARVVLKSGISGWIRIKQ